jgi:hypothetical protein
MKKTLSLILAVLMLLLGLASCGTEEQKPADTGVNPAQTENAQTGQAGQTAEVPAEAAEEAAETVEIEPLWPEPDYSDFVMPEETGELIVYGFSFIDDTLRQAIELFERKYPDVTVDYRVYDPDEYRTILQTELPAGRGPDFLLGSDYDLPDIYKTMNSGIFTDYGPYMENDAEYDPGDYYENIMKGGKLFGKQYLLPLVFGVNCLMTTRELLEANGIDPDGIDTWDAFIDACIRFHENNPGKALIDYGSSDGYIDNLYLFCGFSLIDYEKSEVSFDEELFRKMMELCRLYSTPEVPAELPIGGGYITLPKGECLFANRLGAPSMQILNDCGLITYYAEQTPVMVSIPDENGGMSAQILYFASIPEASANKLNAWRFTKILLSDEIQYGTKPKGEWPHNAFPFGDGVRKESLRRMAKAHQAYTACTDEEIEQFLSLVDNVTHAVKLPPILQRYIQLEISPYVRGEKPWDDCYKRFLNTLVLYASE